MVLPVGFEPTMLATQREGLNLLCIPFHHGSILQAVKVLDSTGLDFGRALRNRTSYPEGSGFTTRSQSHLRDTPTMVGAAGIEPAISRL